MAHNTHTSSPENQDLRGGKTKAYYLDLAKDWVDPLPPPVVETVRHQINGVPYMVVREDLVEGGTKRRFGDLLMRSIKEDHVVYVAPRHGHAGIALALLCREHKKKLTLFMPACEIISPNQARAIELGARPVFYRIAAMPNLNAAAKAFAERNKAYFIPLGLKHELVTAAAVTVAHRMFDGRAPAEVWTAMSTGVLSRALQIAWGPTLPRPNLRRGPSSAGAKFFAVAVARNIKDGERGYAEIHSHHRAFTQNAEIQPPFPSASNYDAKVWEYMASEGASKGALFWNVANNESPKNQDYYRIESQVDWGITRVFERRRKEWCYGDVDFKTNTILDQSFSVLGTNP